MKSQFKKADASGARYALIFGADELARGEVAIKPLRDAGGGAAHPAAGRRRAPGRANCATHNPGTFLDVPLEAPMAHPSRPARAGTARRAQGLLEAYGNLITWALIAGAGGVSPAWNGWNWWQRDQSAKAGAMFDELDRAAQAGDADSAPGASSPT